MLKLFIKAFINSFNFFKNCFIKLDNDIHSLFSDKGNVSFLRFISFIIIIIIMGIFIFKNIHSGNVFVDIGNNAFKLLALTLTAKVGQKFFESASDIAKFKKTSDDDDSDQVSN